MHVESAVLCWQLRDEIHVETVCRALEAWLALSSFKRCISSGVAIKISFRAEANVGDGA